MIIIIRPQPLRYGINGGKPLSSISCFMSTVFIAGPEGRKAGAGLSLLCLLVLLGTCVAFGLNLLGYL